MKHFLIFYLSVCLVFNWPVVAQEALPFTQALEEMVERDVDVGVQRTKLRASESQLAAARGAFTPEIFLAAKQAAGDSTLPSTGASFTSERFFTANATWNLFRSGADWAKARSANQNVTRNSSLLDNSYLHAQDKAARALLGLLATKQALEAYRRSEQSAAHFLEIAKARFSKGLLAREESDKVALDAANTEARRVDAEARLNESRGKVEALLGHARIGSEWPWAKRLNEEIVKDLLSEEARTQMLEGRPDFRAGRAAVEAEDWRSRSSFRRMLPSLDVTYSVGQTQPLYPRNQSRYSSWSTMATLTIPLWSGLSDYSVYREHMESRHAAEHLLRQLEKDARSEVEVAQANYRLRLQHYRTRENNLAIAKRILEQDEARFRIGRADANELNVDLKRVTEAEILAIEGNEQAHLAYMQLLHACGRRL